jgi:hypothetical protein
MRVSILFCMYIRMKMIKSVNRTFTPASEQRNSGIKDAVFDLYRIFNTTTASLSLSLFILR